MSHPEIQTQLQYNLGNPESVAIVHTNNTNSDSPTKSIPTFVPKRDQIGPKQYMADFLNASGGFKATIGEAGEGKLVESGRL